MSDSPKGPFEALWREVERPGGVALTLGGTALALVAIFVLPDWKLPAQWPITIAIVAVVIFAWARQALANALSARDCAQAQIVKLEFETQPHTPKVIYATPNPSDESELILLLEPNRLFGQSMLVSVYYEDEREFEQLVATGRVATVQINGKIQVAILEWEQAHQELKRHVTNRDTERLSRLLVRPAPTTDFAVIAAQRDALASLLSAGMQRVSDDD